MDEFRLARLALCLPVIRRPGQHRPHGIGIARAIEEIVRRGLGLAAGAFRIGERGGIGAGDVGNLVLCEEACQRLGIGRTPAHDRRDFVAARPLLVERDRARDLIAIVIRIHVELLAADAAVLVDPGERVCNCLPVGRADVRGAARIIGQMADRDLGLRGRRQRRRAAARAKRNSTAIL